MSQNSSNSFHCFSSGCPSQRLQEQSQETCGCGKIAQLRRSWTTENPGRRFLGCANYKNHQACDYFKWVDPELCDNGREICAILRSTIIEKKEKLNYLEREHDQLEAKHARLKQKYEAIQVENAVLQAEKQDLQQRLANMQRRQYSAKPRWRIVLAFMVLVAFISWWCSSSPEQKIKKKLLYLP